MERREAALFLFEYDKRRLVSCLEERFRRGALPNGSGGREAVGELENTSVPWGLQRTPPGVGMAILGDTDGN